MISKLCECTAISKEYEFYMDIVETVETKNLGFLALCSTFVLRLFKESANNLGNPEMYKISGKQNGTEGPYCNSSPCYV